jgi:hypothetical protein
MRSGAWLVVGSVWLASAIALLEPIAAGVASAAPPPRYRSSGGLARVMSGAPVADDFEAARIDETRWRLWISDPGRARVEQKEGRLWIQVRGTSGYNGLVSLADLPTRDVEAICRAGIASKPGAKHGALVHLCGSGKLSPDHWLEVQLRDRSGSGNASINVAVPREHRTGYTGVYELPPPRGDGYDLRVSCDEASGTCRGLALAPFSHGDGGEWWQLGDGFKVPARRSRLEIKAAGWAEPGADSQMWFDDCRLYPRPQTHGVTVVLKRPDGAPPAPGTDCLGPGDERIPGCNLVVRLYDEGGARLVDEASTGTGYGYAMLSLARSEWDTYPVGAVIRVFANARQLGPDHVIRKSGVTGLYPDDVYSITLE